MFKWSGKIIDEKKEWSIYDIYVNAEKLKGFFVKNGVKKGENIAVICDNSAYFIIAFFGILFSGGIPVVLNTNLPVKQVNNICDEYNIRYICKYYINKTNKTFSKEEINVKKIINNITECKSSDDIELDDDDVAMILFSSGTTGIPNGVMLSHKAVLANIIAILDYSRIDSIDVLYVAKSLAHSSSIIGELLLSIYCGATVILKSTVISPSTLLKRIDRYRVSVLVVNPILLDLITNSHEKIKSCSLRVIYTCGAPVSNNTIERGLVKFSGVDIFNMYGATEAGPRVTAQLYGKHNTLGSAGYPIKGTKVMIVHDNFNECKSNVSGNILVKSQSLMTGYYNNEEKTKKKFWNNWLITGDLGFLNEDGELFVSGRKDDIIIRSAHNVDPLFVENAILKLKCIKECVVFGEKKSDGDVKEVCIFIADYPIEKRLIIDHCKKELASYEIPQEFIQVSKIPLNINGKVSRKMLSEDRNIVLSLIKI